MWACALTTTTLGFSLFLTRCLPKPLFFSSFPPRAKSKKWRGVVDLSQGRYSPPQEPYLLVPPLLTFNVLLLLPFALTFSTLAAPSLHSPGKVTCGHFPYL